MTHYVHSKAEAKRLFDLLTDLHIKFIYTPSQLRFEIEEFDIEVKA